MKIQYLEEAPNIQLLEKLTRKKIKSLKIGNIEVGKEKILSPSNEEIVVPITKKGIEVDFEDVVKENDLTELDKYLEKKGLKRNLSGI